VQLGIFSLILQSRFVINNHSDYLKWQLNLTKISINNTSV